MGSKDLRCAVEKGVVGRQKGKKMGRGKLLFRHYRKTTSKPIDREMTEGFDYTRLLTRIVVTLNDTSIQVTWTIRSVLRIARTSSFIAELCG